MKNTITILTIIVCCISSCKQKQSIQTEELKGKTYDNIEINQESINPLLTNKYLDSAFITSQILTIETKLIIENFDTLNIELQNVEGWNDPGDFLRIQIKRPNDSIIFSEKNTLGWIKHRLNPEVKLKSCIPSDYFQCYENKSGKQLILFSYTYASQPGIMTIIDLFPEPTIIFNQQFELDSLSVNAEKYVTLFGTRNYVDRNQIETKRMTIK